MDSINERIESLQWVDFIQHFGSIPRVAPLRGTRECLRVLTRLHQSRIDRETVSLTDKCHYAELVISLVKRIRFLQRGGVQFDTSTINEEYLQPVDPVTGDEGKQPDAELYAYRNDCAFYYDGDTKHDMLPLEAVIQTIELARHFVADITDQSARCMQEEQMVQYTFMVARVIGMLAEADAICRSEGYDRRVDWGRPFRDIKHDLDMYAVLTKAIHYWLRARVLEERIRHIEYNSESNDRMGLNHANDNLEIAFYLWRANRLMNSSILPNGCIRITFPDSGRTCVISGVCKTVMIDETSAIPPDTEADEDQTSWVVNVRRNWLLFMSRYALRMGGELGLSIATMNCYGHNGGYITAHDSDMQNTHISVRTEMVSIPSQAVATAMATFEKAAVVLVTAKELDYIENGVPVGKEKHNLETYVPKLYVVPEGSETRT